MADNEWRVASATPERATSGLYDDDGETFDYERGEYSWTTLHVFRDGRGGWQGSATPDPRGKRWHYSGPIWTFMTN